MIALQHLLEIWIVQNLGRTRTTKVIHFMATRRLPEVSHISTTTVSGTFHYDPILTHLPSGFLVAAYTKTRLWLEKYNQSRKCNYNHSLFTVVNLIYILGPRIPICGKVSGEDPKHRIQ